jgi:hypothetical protein
MIKGKRLTNIMIIWEKITVGIKKEIKKW